MLLMQWGVPYYYASYLQCYLLCLLPNGCPVTVRPSAAMSLCVSVHWAFAEGSGSLAFALVYVLSLCYICFHYIYSSDNVCQVCVFICMDW